MQVYKPQALLLQTAPGQIGQKAFLGVSLGVGFRLSDPRILCHEAVVQHALSGPQQSVPLVEMALPKTHAEWLLAGHAVHALPARHAPPAVRWTCSVELAGVRKALRCQAAVAPAAAGEPQDTRYARLLLDHRNVWTGLAQENPCGTTQEAASLQLQRNTEASAGPLAGTGALATPWPARARWRPEMYATVEQAAGDGSHMGWPAHTDLRYFQQAAPDQWAEAAQWPPGAHYVLKGLGPGGEGFANSLPRLCPHAVFQLRGSAAFSALALAQQSVWFLPDDDLALLWWNGQIALDYLLEDRVATLVAALRGAGEAQDDAALADIARRRANSKACDYASLSEQLLMPRVADGWTWQQIESAEDHPNESPRPRSYEELRQGVEAQQAVVDELSRRQQAQDPALSELPRPRPAAALVPAEQPHAWLARLHATPDKQLRDVTLEGQNLRQRDWSGWTLENVVFKHCDMERSRIADAQWTNVHLEQCSLQHAVLERLQWTRGRMESCHAGHSLWQDVQLEDLSFGASDIEGARFCGGSCKHISLADLYGAQGEFHGLTLEGCCLQDCKLPSWRWQQLTSKLLVLVRCQLPGLQVQRSRFASLSAVEVDCSASRWQVCRFDVAVLDSKTRLVNSLLSDCQFSKTSAIGLQASRLRAQHCSLAELNAQQLQADQSHWTACALQGAQLSQACLAQAVFEGCCLREARLYGADLRRSRMLHCNLIGAQSCWALHSDSERWRANLTAGYLDLPRRRA